MPDIFRITNIVPKPFKMPDLKIYYLDKVEGNLEDWIHKDKKETPMANTNDRRSYLVQVARACIYQCLYTLKALRVIVPERRWRDKIDNATAYLEDADEELSTLFK